MPPVNQAALASAGIIVASVAVAAAIALYESPELRRVADDLRRRIAIALHSLGDNLDPGRQEPLFNRPEDAEGFMRSRGASAAEDGVDADDETRRRQREELMYWNAKREELEEKKRMEAEKAANSHQSSPHRSLTFDDFLREDKTAERGTFVYNTGASRWGDEQQQGIRRRGVEGVRGLSASMIANPFGDEYGIELNEHAGMTEERHALSPGRDEAMSDIYNATPLDARSLASQTLSPQSKPVVPEVLFDFDSQTRSQSDTADPATFTELSFKGEDSVHDAPSVYHELADNEYMTAGQDDRDTNAYASIQAWAQGSNPFYSPLPQTPVAPVSEPELISHGQLTPTCSTSVASGEDIANDVASSKGGDYDVLSDEEEQGIPTPNSWSEVGSVVSENESMHA